MKVTYKSTENISRTNCDSLYVAIINGGFELSSGSKSWLGTKWCYSIPTVYSTRREQWICPTLCIRFETHFPQNEWWRYVDEYRLLDAYADKIGLPFFKSSRLLQAFVTQLLRNHFDAGDPTSSRSIDKVSSYNPLNYQATPSELPINAAGSKGITAPRLALSNPIHCLSISAIFWSIFLDQVPQRSASQQPNHQTFDSSYLVPLWPSLWESP